MNMVQTDFMTLTRFMIERTQANPDQADLESLLASIQVCVGNLAVMIAMAQTCL